MLQQKIYEIRFTDLTERMTYNFYVNGIDEILKGDFFNTSITDAKSLETITLKEKILKKLSNEVVDSN